MAWWKIMFMKIKYYIKGKHCGFDGTYMIERITPDWYPWDEHYIKIKYDTVFGRWFSNTFLS